MCSSGKMSMLREGRPQFLDNILERAKPSAIRPLLPAHLVESRALKENSKKLSCSELGKDILKAYSGIPRDLPNSLRWKIMILSIIQPQYAKSAAHRKKIFEELQAFDVDAQSLISTKLPLGQLARQTESSPPREA